MALIENIKEKCSENNLTISDLEQKAGLGKNTIYKWETVVPSVDKVAKVAAVLGVAVDDLLK